MKGMMMWLGPTGVAALLAGVYFVGWPQLQLWWQKDRRAYCEARLTDYETRAKAAQEMIVLERDRLKAELQEVDREHQNRVSAMRARHERAFDSLSGAYQDSCARLSEAASPAGGNDAAAPDNGFPQGIARRLSGVAVIADEQAERLVWCQSYVRSLQ